MLLRNTLFCLSNQFLLNWCCAPSIGWYVKIQNHFLLKQFECTKCKATFKKIVFNIFGFFMPFWWEWQLALCILSDFTGIKNLNGLNDLNSLNNLSGLNDLNSLISSKNLYFKVKMYIFDGLLLFITWKRPLKVKP